MTEERPPTEDQLAEALANAMSHPVRGSVLMILQEFGPKSAREVAADVGESADTVRYHLRRLRAEGLVESVEERARRGVVERFYRSVRAPFVDDDEYSRLAPTQKMRLAVQILKAIFADTSKALRAGTLEGRVDHLTRVRLRVDDQGWKELLKIHRTALDAVERVKEESEERCAAGEDGCIYVTSALLCFECPPKL